MWQPPPPPTPPSEGKEFLLTLADYYRDLVEYHQKSAGQAHLRLTYVEALLPDSVRDASLVEEASPPLFEQRRSLREPSHLNGANTQSAEADARRETQVEPQEYVSFSLEKPPQQSSDSPQPPELDQPLTPTDNQIAELLEANRGKILHLDYIVMELAAPKPNYVGTVTAAVDKLLGQGEQQERWASVPDSPNCWTIDLREIPDLVSEKASSVNTPSGKTQKTSYPPSEKLEEYESLSHAILGCLKEHYPSSLNTGDIFDWLYPDGLSKQQEFKMKKAIGNALLNRGKSLGWRRVKVGQYAWSGS